MLVVGNYCWICESYLNIQYTLSEFYQVPVKIFELKVNEISRNELQNYALCYIEKFLYLFKLCIALFFGAFFLIILQYSSTLNLSCFYKSFLNTFVAYRLQFRAKKNPSIALSITFSCLWDYVLLSHLHLKFHLGHQIFCLCFAFFIEQSVQSFQFILLCPRFEVKLCHNFQVICLINLCYHGIAI